MKTKQIEYNNISITIIKKFLVFIFLILISNFSYTQKDFNNWDSILVIQRFHLRDTILFTPCLYKDLVIDSNKVIK